MTVLSKFADAMEFNGSLMQENYAWVDKRLEEMYYGYALTTANCDEYEAAGLLKENYDWVDQRLEEMCCITDRNMIRVSCRAPLTWANYRSDAKLESIEDKERSIIGRKRKRSESDISDYEVEAGRAIKRLRCQLPIHSGKYITIPNSVYDEEMGLDSEVSTLIDEQTHYVSEDDENPAKVCPVDDDSEISCYDMGYDSY